MEVSLVWRHLPLGCESPLTQIRPATEELEATPNRVAHVLEDHEKLTEVSTNLPSASSKP